MYMKRKSTEFSHNLQLISLAMLAINNALENESTGREWNLHVSIGSGHDFEHRLQVLGVAAHRPKADVLFLSARCWRVLVLTRYNTFSKQISEQM